MKKYSAFLFFLMFFTFLIGCKKEDQELKVIEEEMMFFQEGESYYIYFFKDGCSGCETIKPTIIKYLNKQAENSSELIMLYGVNLAKEGEEKSIISKGYSGEDGQGTDGKFFVDGVTLWGRLYIASTPSLILIETIDGVKTAKYVGQGTSANVYLNKYL